MDFNAEIVPTEKLKWSFPSNLLTFSSTENVTPIHSIIGQPRALEAIKLGSQIRSKGYNIFVTGLSGTGRLTAVKQILEQISTSCPIMYDFCYVNNFSDASKPHLLRMQKGFAILFSEKMNETIDFLRQRIPVMFEEEPYKNIREKTFLTYNDKEKNIVQEFDNKIKPLGFIRGQLETDDGKISPDIFYYYNGKITTNEDFEQILFEKKISEKKSILIRKRWEEFREELKELSKNSMKIMVEFRKEIKSQDQNAIEILCSSIFDEIYNKFKIPNYEIQNKTLLLYINEVKDSIINNFQMFLINEDDSHLQSVSSEEINSKDYFHLFKVNILIDNTNIDTAPIIIERNPNYVNLFGTFDKSSDTLGNIKSDFSMIKAGSILQADQGYLIVSAEDLFIDPAVWYSLKRVLLYGKLEIQSVETFYSMVTTHLKPEPINVNVKVIIIGGETLYRQLYFYEKGFKKIFKINAQFDNEIIYNDELLLKYVSFVSHLCFKENLKHCTKEAIKILVEWAVESSGTQNKITLKFSDIADLIRESSYYSELENDSKYIEDRHLITALENRKFRNNLIDEKLSENILFNDILIDTDGFKIGEINALTVIDNGSISFGKPSKISVNVSIGNKGIINIERESNMSGNLHNKGVMILSGFLMEKFAQDYPLSITATIAFEQNYGGIDGDSATAAEIVALFSSLSDIPINQNLAITGSVNQKGLVQPIGGANEKIYGFYDICKKRGLNGKQGVLIPSQNIKDLMLPNDLINDVKNNMFSIYSFHTIEQAITLFLNKNYGKLNTKNQYTKNSICYLIKSKLDRYNKIYYKKLN